ncbi:MAG: aromatic ring-hydroxylating dioxygenase subunit alpha, partial [Parvibaculaceae bacterium]
MKRLDTTLSELTSTAKRPFEDATAMPPGVYTNEAFLAREIETIFAKEWVCIGRSSALKEPGDYITYDLAGQPIVVLRDNERKLKAFSNVCLHRMSTLLEGQGYTRSIVCRYHAWTFNLDGSVRGAPFMKPTT